MAVWTATAHRDKTTDKYSTPNATTKLYAWRQNDTVIYTLTPNINRENNGEDCFFDAEGKLLRISSFVPLGVFTYSTPNKLYFEGED